MVVTFSEVEIMREEIRRRADTRLIDFIYYTNWKYKANWHHTVIADELDDFLESETVNKLMLFVPPQHGKSEITSRALPAYELGRNPNAKIAACSYSIDLARGFNRSVQRIIDSKEYVDIFPNTRLGKRRVVADGDQNYLKNTEEFEVVGYSGSYKSVGIMGPLSGRPVDLAIIDDPIKDKMEANSKTYRDRVWDWFINVLEQRLHNKSKVILIMTRWHEDDLAGRLIEKEPDEWKVIKIKAVKEADGHPKDPRKIGEALWPERHSLEKLLKTKAKSLVTFTSLLQQEPAPAEGNKVKRDWWEYCHEKEVPVRVWWDLWIDGAYTKQTENDPSGLMVAGFDEITNTLYVKHAQEGFLEMPELIDLIKDYTKLHRLGYKSSVYIEPKASGKSLAQMLKKQTKLSPVEIDGHLVREGKEARIQVAAPKIQSGRVVLVRGNWTDKFTNQICTFPNAAHDEFVDLIGYACYQYFDSDDEIYVSTD